VKLLSFDLDGTIVPDGKIIPEPIRDAIRKAREAGYLVTVITGRTETSARPFLDILELETPYGTAQGARVQNADGSVLFEHKLEGLIAQKLVEVSKMDGFFVATGEKFYVLDPNHERWHWAHNEGHHVTAWSKYQNESVYKIVFDSASNGLQQKLEQHHQDLMFYPWGNQYLEVTRGGATKGTALALIAKTLGIQQENTIAFGDGGNDQAMLEWAGRSIVVDGGDLTLEREHERIPRPAEFGVATWIEQNLL
jgi:Cof subfamily protein (haloacid dehalogenase superfamily)